MTSRPASRNKDWASWNTNNSKPTMQKKKRGVKSTSAFCPLVLWFFYLFVIWLASTFLNLWYCNNLSGCMRNCGGKPVHYQAFLFDFSPAIVELIIWFPSETGTLPDTLVTITNPNTFRDQLNDFLQHYYFELLNWLRSLCCVVFQHSTFQFVINSVFSLYLLHCNLILFHFFLCNLWFVLFFSWIWSLPNALHQRFCKVK